VPVARRGFHRTVHIYVLPSDSCPACGNGIVDFGGAMPGTPEPSQGDAAVCLGCANALLFETDLQLVFAANEWINALPAEERTHLLLMQRAADRARRFREPQPVIEEEIDQ
jgi:hypothetical protein